MIKALSSLLVITLAGPTHVQSAPESPCPDVFTYEPLGTEAGRWYGIINLATITQSTPGPVTINIVLDNKADLLVNWIGEVITTDNKDYKIENTEKKIQPGSSQTIRFYVQYNPLEKPPKLKGIRLNGRDICLPVIDIRADTTNSSSPPIVKPDPTTPSGTGTSSSNSNNYECGKVVLNNNHINTLVVNGMPTLEGQWPWQIALYKTELVDNKFMCGGTLVTRQHVITAAHCVTERGTDIVFNRNTLTVYLGKHNLWSSVDGVQIRYVSSIMVHPEYNASAISKDLSILKLRGEPISITKWVRPACLWPEDKIDLDNVIGKNGSVVGWGYDETGYPTKELTLVEMPVVDQLTCLRSYNEFFSQFTSDYTLCAGFRDGKSVCNGDSGGGMVFNMDDSWYLRGLVSLSAAKPNEARCNPKHYVVFTDLAKFLPWIKERIAS